MSGDRDLPFRQPELMVCSHQLAHFDGSQPSDEVQAKARRDRNLCAWILRRHREQYVQFLPAKKICVLTSIVIRAYYSKRNETMLTCTVSMVETAVAIIATCLPRSSPLFHLPFFPLYPALTYISQPSEPSS